MVSNGAPGVCTTLTRLQNPPVTEYCPPLVAGLASCWPMVPLKANCPFVPEPPPPAILCQSKEYCWAKPGSENRQPQNRIKDFTSSMSCLGVKVQSLADDHRTPGRV